MTKDEIIVKFNEFLRWYGKTKSNSDFYIGVTSSLEDRLFTSHKVRKNEKRYIACYADSENVAREVEKIGLAQNMQGDTGGGTGDGDVRWVYCYELMDYTDPKKSDYK